MSFFVQFFSMSKQYSTSPTGMPGPAAQSSLLKNALFKHLKIAHGLRTTVVPVGHSARGLFPVQIVNASLLVLFALITKVGMLE